MKKKGFKIVLALILLIALLSFFVYAQPPFETNANIDIGLQIFYPPLETVKQNTDFNFHIHLSNITNGFPRYNNIDSCFLDLYNSTGDHTLEKGVLNKNANLYDHELFIDGNNFSDLGQHAFFIWCNSSDTGGGVKGGFKVTPSGRGPPTEGEGMVYISSVIAMIFFSLILFLISTTFKTEREVRRGKHGEEKILERGSSVLRFGFIGASFVVAIIGILYVQAASLEIIPGFADTLGAYDIFYYVSLLILIIIIIFTIVSLIFQSVEALRIKKGKALPRGEY